MPRHENLTRPQPAILLRLYRDGWLLGLFTLLTTFHTASDSAAGDGRCQQFDTITGHHLKVRVDARGASNFANNITEDNFTDAVLLAMDAFNSQSNSVFLQYDGSTTANDVSCLGDGYSVVRAVDEAASNRASQGCPGNRQFLITITSKFPTSGLLRDWGLATSELQASGKRDLVSTITHELAHGLGLNHPWDVLPLGPDEEGDLCTGSGQGTCSAGLICQPTGQTSKCSEDEASVLSGAETQAGRSIRRRWLFEYDLKCIEELRGDREFSSVRRYVVNGSVGSPSTFSGTWNVANTNAAAYTVAGTWRWGASLHRDGGKDFTTDLSTSLTNSVSASDGFRNSGSMCAATFREESSATIKNFYVYGRDAIQDIAGFVSAKHEKDSVQVLRRTISSDGFDGVDSDGFAYACLQMSQSSSSTNLNCTGALQLVKTPFGVSYSYLDGLQQSVVAWVEHERSSAEHANELRVSVGVPSNATFSLPESLGLYSNVQPGVACKQNAAKDNADCIVVFVDATTRSQEMLVQRLNVFFDPAQRRYRVTKVGLPLDVRGGSSFSRRTSSRIAAWHHDGTFMIAYKTSEPGQKVKVLKSVDGHGDQDTSWDFVTTLATSVTGPSVVGALQNTNVILTTE